MTPRGNREQPYTAGRDEPSCGVYCLWWRDGLQYVGLSNHIGVRLLQHWRAGKIRFDHYSYVECRESVLPFVEAAYIFGLEPPCNAKYEQPQWRGHERMARLIERVWRKGLRG